MSEKFQFELSHANVQEIETGWEQLFIEKQNKKKLINLSCVKIKQINLTLLLQVI